jgi:hypothetical protein
VKILVSNAARERETSLLTDADYARTFANQRQSTDQERKYKTGKQTGEVIPPLSDSLLPLSSTAAVAAATLEKLKEKRNTEAANNTGPNLMGIDARSKKNNSTVRTGGVDNLAEILPRDAMKEPIFTDNVELFLKTICGDAQDFGMWKRTHVSYDDPESLYTTIDEKSGDKVVTNERMKNEMESKYSELKTALGKKKTLCKLLKSQYEY